MVETTNMLNGLETCMTLELVHPTALQAWQTAHGSNSYKLLLCKPAHITNQAPISIQHTCSKSNGYIPSVLAINTRFGH